MLSMHTNLPVCTIEWRFTFGVIWLILYFRNVGRFSNKLHINKYYDFTWESFDMCTVRIFVTCVSKYLYNQKKSSTSKNSRALYKMTKIAWNEAIATPPCNSFVKHLLRISIESSHSRHCFSLHKYNYLMGLTHF